MLVGRRSEVSQLDDLAAVVGRGMSGVLVIRGEVGVGKTALLNYFAETASDYKVVRLDGVEPEKHLSFAGLHRLLLPFLALVDRLPQAQRQALGSAFGLNQDPPAHPLLLGLSVLTLLADAAQDVPLALVIDDAQWLDVDSLKILGFVARRLYAEPIGMVFASRPSPEPTALDGLPDVSLEGLTQADAIDLLIGLSSDRIDYQEASRVARRAGGNLLVLTEVGRALAEGTAPSDLLVNDLLPVGQRLEAHFLATVRELPVESQTLLLIAAAMADADSRLLWRTAEITGVRPEAALSAQAVRLVEIHPEFRFRHPMIRSAIYFGATEEDRRSVHRQLALAIDEEHDPDLKAWHLAAAAIGYDQEVADALERCANKARERGGYLAEADVLTRSAALSPLRPQRASRTLAAVEAALNGGAYLRAEELLESSASLFDQPLFRAQALRMSASILLQLGRPGGKFPRMLLSAVEMLEPINAELANEIMLEALTECHFRGRFMIDCSADEVGAAALELFSRTHSTDEPSRLIGWGTAMLYSRGFADAASDMKRAVASLVSYARVTREAPRWGTLGSVLSQALWDDKSNREWHVYRHETALRNGDYATLLPNLISSTIQATNRGELAAARIFLSELEQVVRVQGDVDPAFLLALAKCELASWEGDEATVRETAALIYAVGDALNSQLQNSTANRALMIFELGTGRYEQAFSVAAHSFETDLVPNDNWAMPALIEAGVRVGKYAEASVALDELRARATASGTPWALGLLARSEALCASVDVAEPFYREALELLQRAQIPSDLARAHLLYGEWLRDQDRTADSRFELHAALTMFESMGAHPFTDRTRRALQTTGARTQARAAAPASTLSPQEAQIARQAAIGATNREIAAAMFISRHTVDYHLRSVFRKLGINSRRELTQVVEIEASLVPGRLQS